jgi:hypothetical protein
VALLLSPALAAFFIVRDDLIPAKWSDKLYLSSLPSPSFWQWTTIVAVLVIVFILEGAVRFADAKGLVETAEPVRQRLRIGKLDALPELEDATKDYITAQGAINQAMDKATAVMGAKGAAAQGESDSRKQRTLAKEIADAIVDVSDVMRNNLPVLMEKAHVFRQATYRTLRELRGMTDKDHADLITFKETAITSRRQIQGLLRTIRTTQRNTKDLKRKDLSTALNDACDSFKEPLRNYWQVTKSGETTFRRTEGAARRKIIRTAIRRLAVRREASPPQQAA